MAEPKRVEISSAYYSHKRASLLFSVALLVASLPDIRVATDATLLIALNGIPIGLVRAGIALGALYYLANFLFIWFSEANAYARGSASDHGTLVAAMAEQLGRIDHAVTNARRAITISQEIAGSHIDEHLKAHGVIVDQHAFHELLVRLAEHVLLASSVVPSHKPSGRPNPSELVDAFGEKHPWSASKMVTSLSAVRRLTEDIPRQLQQVIAELAETRSGIQRVRNALLRDQWLQRLRLFGLDLLAPLTVFLVAMSHYVGLFGLSILPPITDLLSGLP